MLETTEDCMHTFLPASQQIRGLFFLLSDKAIVLSYFVEYISAS